MAHHHLPPLILSLILLLNLPSSFQAYVTPALFSDPTQYLYGGENLTNGIVTLSLSDDCGLVFYLGVLPVRDFETNTTTSHCILKLNKYGQLVLKASFEQAQTQTIFDKGPEGDYALLFVGPILAIFRGTWNNGVPIPRAIKQGKLKAGTSDNFIFNSQTHNGRELAQNGHVKADINEQCRISVTDVSNGTVIWESTGEYENLTDCFLRLADVGELFLIGFNGTSYVTQWLGGYPGDVNFYVGALRYNGRITIYEFHNSLTNSSSAAAVAAVAAVAVAKNIKMVTG